MTKTSDLIDALAESAVPVRRLRSPLRGALLWLLAAAAVLALLTIAQGIRTDIAIRLQQQAFVLGMFAAVATGILASIAAFELSRPETSRWWLILPLPALAVWVSTIGYGCLTNWIGMGPDGIRMGEAARCFATLVLTSVPLAASMLVALRHAARLRATAVSVAGGLAIAAITSFALSLIHDLDASIMILIWNLGTATVIAGAASLFGRTSFAWIASRIGPESVRFRSR